MQVKIPHRRSQKDISILQDLVEEISRIYWYDNITPKPTKKEIKNQTNNMSVWLQNNIEEILVRDWKMNQVETYPRIEEKSIDIFGFSKQNLLSLKNPFTPQTKFLRNSLVFNLLEIAKKNHKFMSDFNIFDISKTWEKIESSWKDDNLNWKTPIHLEWLWSFVNKNTKIKNIQTNVWDLPKCEFYPQNIVENFKLWILWYRKEIKNRKDDLFLSIKSNLDFIFYKIWISKIKYEISEHTYWHPTKQANIFAKLKKEKIKIWQIYQVHPNIVSHFKIETDSQVVFWEIDIDILKFLISNQEKDPIKYFSFQDQIIQRDLCFVIDKDFSFEKIIWSIKTIPEIINIDVFDLYNWEKLPKWKKSISITINILGDGNFDTNKINSIMDLAIKNAESIWAELRW